MIALFLHFLWVIIYLLFTTFLLILFMFIQQDGLKNLNTVKSNLLLTFIAILLLNKHLKLSSLISTDSVIDHFSEERRKNWPILHSIHQNITNTKLPKIKISNEKNFKKKYQHYYTLSSIFYLPTVFKSKSILIFPFLKNPLIAYNLLLLIVNKYFNTRNTKAINLLFSLLNQRLSYSSKELSVTFVNISKFNDYMKYLSLPTSTNIRLIHNSIQPSTLTFYRNLKKFNLKYTNFKNNYYYFNSREYLATLNNVIIEANFLNKLKNLFAISFSASNIVKYLNDYSAKNSVILYLRKNKVFNKGRYSRNRQTYRTGAYWCLYINIIAIVAFYFWFYKFTINFGYLWWLLYSLILSFLAPRALKYRFYNPVLFKAEVINGFYWAYLLLAEILKPVLNIFTIIKLWYLNSFIGRVYFINTIRPFFKDNAFQFADYFYLPINYLFSINRILVSLINEIKL